MFALVLCLILVIIGVVIRTIDVPDSARRVRAIASPLLIVMGLAVGLKAGFDYNDAGYCQHIRTIFGTESSKCNTGWYFSGWGNSTQYPHEITIAHTNEASASGSSVSLPYSIRTADNWNGTVTQTTRFTIPRDEEQFLTMGRAFRSPERLISATLYPAVTASLDSVANLFTMEEYYAGGQRDQFKTEFVDAITKGRAKVEQVWKMVPGNVVENTARSSDLDATDDGGTVGNQMVRKQIMQKVHDANGIEIRIPHDYTSYGIRVSAAVLENLDPDDNFENQIEARRQAVSRRIIAQEEQLEAEQKRLLVIKQGQTEVARRQAEAEQEQIEKTVNAETERQLTVINAQKLQEEAEILKVTADINLERAKIEAEQTVVLADAEAYQKAAVLDANNALEIKLEAWLESQKAWASAAADINVPQFVFGAGGSDSEGVLNGNPVSTIEKWMQVITMMTAQNLDLDPNIARGPK